MERFVNLDSPVVPIPRSNVDTDQIIPGRFLHIARREGLGRYLFHDLRCRPDGSENAEFVLNRPAYRAARILAADRNFGCGSSRENAVWALYDYGFRAVLAPSFGDIFFNNSLKNGLLPVVLPEAVIGRLLAACEAQPGAQAHIDLQSQTVIVPGGARHEFSIDPFARQCLLEGLDELDYTFSRLAEIAAFERQYES